MDTKAFVCVTSTRTSHADQIPKDICTHFIYTDVQFSLRSDSFTPVNGEFKDLVQGSKHSDRERSVTAHLHNVRASPRRGNACCVSGTVPHHECPGGNRQSNVAGAGSVGLASETFLGVCSTVAPLEELPGRCVHRSTLSVESTGSARRSATSNISRCFSVLVNPLNIFICCYLSCIVLGFVAFNCTCNVLP